MFDLECVRGQDIQTGGQHTSCTDVGRDEVVRSISSVMGDEIEVFMFAAPSFAGAGTRPEAIITFVLELGNTHFAPLSIWVPNNRPAIFQALELLQSNNYFLHPLWGSRPNPALSSLSSK